MKCGHGAIANPILIIVVAFAHGGQGDAIARRYRGGGIGSSRASGATITSNLRSRGNRRSRRSICSNGRGDRGVVARQRRGQGIKRKQVRNEDHLTEGSRQSAL